MQAEALGVLEAALWGLAGGTAAALVALTAAIKAAGYRWPWRGKDGPGKEARERFWARLVVLGGSLLIGAIVAAAAHGQMSGPWPAFLLGVGAEASVRGLLAGVEVAVRKPEEAPPRLPGATAGPTAAPVEAGGEEHADASRQLVRPSGPRCPSAPPLAAADRLSLVGPRPHRGRRPPGSARDRWPESRQPARH
ncbi:hypothetical protein OIE67_19445 [Nonomuraea fuscirosea]|uniref:hypothetical protein n=1 Tax=Nonomuraea fuscirosea TaxID=1291556 RepID=UPI002DD94509|nr:hypothetical protein [Nonomuraea fuscirosea]WSA56705.1 hypothetical protein OIE67_19445 [Nonomuraea fuscirosea]